MATRRRQADRSQATRAALVGAARPLFAEHGYAAVSTDDIVEAASVTRGALYHHYRDKRDLFRAVYEQVEHDLMERIAAATATAGDVWAMLTRGLSAFLDECLDPEVARIALVDAPAVLGWEEWREIDARYGLGLIVAALQHGMDSGVLRRASVDVLAQVVFGAMAEAALLIAHADNPKSARRAAEESLLALLSGLRA